MAEIGSFMYISDKDAVYERCCELGLENFNKDTALILARFDDYYYAANYPGNSFIELKKEQAEEALITMTSVNNMVKDKLN